MTFLAVALQAFEPRFDPVEELWYINVPLRTDPLPFPRVRLGLVRYQPNAREDDLPLEGEEPVRLRVSAPVTEWAKPLPGRRATATCRQRADGCTEVIVTVDGPSAMPNDQAGANPDMVVEVIRFRNDGGLLQELTAKDDKGADAICKEWSSDALQSPPSCGVLRRVAAGLSWSCMFVLSGALQHDGWSHAVVVRETRELPKANVEDGDTERKEKTGPNFVARVELNPK